MPPIHRPSHDTRIRRVDSFEELLATPFGDGINALCWARTLTGDFGEVVARLGSDPREGIVTLDDDRLRGLELSAAGQSAVAVLFEDLRRLRDYDKAPELNLIHHYLRDEEPGPVPTDLYSWHADSAPVETETWLCTYHGLPSEGLCNEEAQRRIDHPETRAELLRQFGGADDDDFRDYLSDHCYDLHFAALPGAQPYSFGRGNLWRIAVAWPGSPVPPCIHRAPETPAGEAPRLLLIS